MVVGEEVRTAGGLWYIGRVMDETTIRPAVLPRYSHGFDLLSAVGNVVEIDSLPKRGQASWRRAAGLYRFVGDAQLMRVYGWVFNQDGGDINWFLDRSLFRGRNELSEERPLNDQEFLQLAEDISRLLAKDRDLLALGPVARINRYNGNLRTDFKNLGVWVRMDSRQKVGPFIREMYNKYLNPFVVH